MSVQVQDLFFSSPAFAVVGASKDRTKYGNRLLKWYQVREKNVTPVHPKETDIEGLTPVKALADLSEPTKTSVSVVTPPKITLSVLEQAKQLDIPALWIQPGAEDENVIKYVEENGLTEKVIFGGPCVLVLGDGALERVAAKANL